MDRSLPRSAPSFDGQARPKRVQADASVGRLLAWRTQEPDALAHLRDRVAQQEAARATSRAAGGSGQARSPQDRAGDGPLSPPARSARKRVLASEGMGHLAPAR